MCDSSKEPHWLTDHRSEKKMKNYWLYCGNFSAVTASFPSKMLSISLMIRRRRKNLFLSRGVIYWNANIEKNIFPGIDTLLASIASYGTALVYTGLHIRLEDGTLEVYNSDRDHILGAGTQLKGGGASGANAQLSIFLSPTSYVWKNIFCYYSIRTKERAYTLINNFKCFSIANI